MQSVCAGTQVQCQQKGWDRAGGGGWNHLQGSVHMVTARIGCKRGMFGTEWAYFHPVCIKGLENSTLTL